MTNEIAPYYRVVTVRIVVVYPGIIELPAITRASALVSLCTCGRPSHLCNAVRKEGTHGQGSIKIDWAGEPKVALIPIM